MTQCGNCQSRLEGAYRATCGQRDIDLERPIWSLVGDILKERFEADGRLAVTLKTLFRSPGKLTSEFLIISDWSVSAIGLDGEGSPHASPESAAPVIAD